jgi:hypothetical protein
MGESRPWYRLHPSSYVAMLLGATLIFFLNVPGQYTPYVGFDGQEKYSIEFCVNDRIEHGWPWAYLRRDTLPSNWNWNSMIAPEPVSLWSLSQEVTEFRWLPLLANATVAIFVLVFVAISFEYWRRQRRRVFQLRLGDLLIGTAVVAVAIAYALKVEREYDRERAALAELGLERGDYVRSLGGPTWLLQLLPESFVRVLSVFDRVVQIELDDLSKFDIVGQFKHLRALKVGGPNWSSGDNVGGLGELTNLEAIEFNRFYPKRGTDEDYTDAESDAEFARGLRQLARLPRLAALDVSDSSFGDKSAAAIASFTKLRILDAGETLVTDQGLAHLGSIDSLEEIHIEGENITDNGLRHLVRLKRLRRLSLLARDVTDQGLLHVGRLKELRRLDLRETSVRGPGLTHLHGLTKLESFVPPRAIEPGAISVLERHLPSLRAIR